MGFGDLGPGINCLLYLEGDSPSSNRNCLTGDADLAGEGLTSLIVRGPLTFRGLEGRRTGCGIVIGCCAGWYGRWFCWWFC